ncbi:unnamed protein product [Bursaphelenchus okinawaensis]|uniref:Uncharacterized protein n=1 Tax=Bursaphelenchus okinawaensis TaxID=465554 RepID=A0A811LKQ1_9BILA|nr:unnamed protein product [Bursaphelenchus okinawaensis]CAG9124861.1 unnamed protein product [Bursaphelenchus okinawaensis]
MQRCILSLLSLLLFYIASTAARSVDPREFLLAQHLFPRSREVAALSRRSIDTSELEDVEEDEETVLKLRPITRSMMLNDSPMSPAHRERLMRLNRPYPSMKAPSLMDRNFGQAMKSILLRIH